MGNCSEPQEKKAVTLKQDMTVTSLKKASSSQEKSNDSKAPVLAPGKVVSKTNPK